VELPIDLGDEFTNGPLPGRDGHADEEIWWRTFDSSSLDQAVARVMEGNLGLSVLAARVEQAEALARTARSARLPGVEVAASAGRARSPSLFEPVTNNQFSASASATWEVDVWGRAAAGADAARLDADAAAIDVSAAHVSVAAQAVEAWLDLAWAAESERLIAEQLATQQRLLDTLRHRFEIALASGLDLEQQRAVVLGIQAGIPRTEAARQTAALRLAALAGDPGGAAEFQAESLPVLPPLPDTGIPADLLERRPDVVAARVRAEAADARAAQAVAARLPSLRLSGSLFFQATSLTDLLDTLFWNIAAGIAAPVFEGGRRRAEIDRTRAAFDERVLAWADTVVQAAVEVETALALERSQHELLARLSERADSAARALELARSRYAEGTDDFIRTLSASATLLQVQQEQLDARRQLLSYRVQLHRALGGHWQPPREQTP
jgi:NodT family efflux transporter outer membrane factor (OMF) lipoprotein